MTLEHSALRTDTSQNPERSISVKRALVRPFALMAYALRKRRYKNRNFPVRWLSNARRIADDLLLLRKYDKGEVINERFIDRLVTAKVGAQKRLVRLSTVSTGALVYLLLGAFSIDSPLSIGGLTLARAPGLNEMLLVLLVLMTFLGVSPFLNTYIIGNAIKSTVKMQFPTPVAQLYQQGAFPEDAPLLYQSPARPHLAWTGFTKLANMIIVAYLATAVAGIAIVLLGSRWMIYSYILSNPSLPDYWTIIVTIGSIVLELWTLVYILVFIVPLPYRDYTLLQRLNELDQTDPGEAQSLRNAAFGDEIADEVRMREAGYLR